MTTIDWAALGFAFTAADVSATLGIDPAAVNDLVRSGDLACLVVRTSEAMPRPKLLFHPDDVRDFGRRMRSDRLSVSAALTARIQPLLREYLREVPAVEDYDEALALDAPLLAGTRSGADALHIRTQSVADFHARAHPAEEGIVTASAVQTVLERLGALRVRGLTGVADRGGKQRWGVWWRVPLSLIDGGNESAAAADAALGVRLGGEKVTKRGRGPAFLESPLGLE
jgi:hypothetical protein